MKKKTKSVKNPGGYIGEAMRNGKKKVGKKKAKVSRTNVLDAWMLVADRMPMIETCCATKSMVEAYAEAWRRMSPASTFRIARVEIREVSK